MSPCRAPCWSSTDPTSVGWAAGSRRSTAPPRTASSSAMCEEWGRGYGLDVRMRQTNHEGELLDWLNEAADNRVPVVLNAGSLDALLLRTLRRLRPAHRAAGRGAHLRPVPAAGGVPAHLGGDSARGGGLRRVRPGRLPDGAGEDRRNPRRLTHVPDQVRLPSQVRDAASKPLNPSPTPEVWVTVTVMKSPASSRTGQLTLTKVATRWWPGPDRSRRGSSCCRWSRSPQSGCRRRWRRSRWRRGPGRDRTPGRELRALGRVVHGGHGLVLLA